MEIICCCTKPPRHFNRNLWLNLLQPSDGTKMNRLGLTVHICRKKRNIFMRRLRRTDWRLRSLTCRPVRGGHRSSSWQPRVEELQQTRRTYQLLPLLLLRPRPRPLSWHCRDWSEIGKISLVIWLAGWLGKRCSQHWLWMECLRKRNKTSVNWLQTHWNQSLSDEQKFELRPTLHSVCYLAPLIKQNVLQIILGNDNHCKNHKKERDSLTRADGMH